VVRSGVTEFIPEVTDEVLEDAVATSRLEEVEVRSIIEVLQPTSVITVPLMTPQRVIGAMQFVSAESRRRYDTDDVSFLEAVAGRVAATLDNIWLTDQHRLISANLQRALLPPQLPRVPGIEVAARYQPAEGVPEVGGDFYDIFSTDGGAWSIVIGDTCGTGSNAAALTSIARHTIRAAARHGRTHREVMDWLNQAVLLSDRDLFCTACYATLREEGDGWRLAVSAAGHPLPIVAHVDAPARTVGHHGTLLGVFEDISTTREEVLVRSGDVVVFYTDGVTDLPPPAQLDEQGLAELVDGMAALDSASAIAEAMVDSVRERVPDAMRRDDIALLVLKIG
jgi:serine phosphatase RsbU (regulator of sigma subunit)